MHDASSTESAQVLMDRLDSGPSVSGVVPAGYPRYLRILAPVGIPGSPDAGRPEQAVRWSEVCERFGIDLAANTLWKRDIASDDAHAAQYEGPGLGVGDVDFLERTGKILQLHEPHERPWFFATWDGYGTEPSQRKVRFRSYHHDTLELSVFERWNRLSVPFDLPLLPLRRSAGTEADFGWSLASSEHESSGQIIESCDPGLVPMYWWPDGNEWVLAQPLYGTSVYLACGDEIADEVLSGRELEVIEVSVWDEADHEE